MDDLSVNEVGHAFSLCYWDMQTYSAFAVNTRISEKREHVDLVDAPKHLILVHINKFWVVFIDFYRMVNSITF